MKKTKLKIFSAVAVFTFTIGMVSLHSASAQSTIDEPSCESCVQNNPGTCDFDGVKFDGECF